jgi:hypothetical protein
MSGENRRGGGRRCRKCGKREGRRTRLRQMQQKKERKNMNYLGNSGNEKEEEGSLVKGAKRKRKKVLVTEVKIEGRGRRFR